MFCKNCGAEIKNDGKFCPKCGAQNRIIQESAVQIKNQKGIDEDRVNAAASVQPVPNTNGAELAPVMTVGSYLLLFILSAIPIVGIIAIIIFALDNANKNRSNYCKAMILMWVISVLFIAIFWSSLVGAIFSLA